MAQRARVNRVRLCHLSYIPYGSNTQRNTLCRFPVVVVQHPAEPFAPKHRSGQLPHFRRRSDDRVLESLVIPLRVIMLDVVWVQQSAQAEVVMRQELEYGVNFSFAAYRMRAGFGPQTTPYGSKSQPKPKS